MKAISIISFALLRISQKQKLPLLLILGFSYCAWALSPALAYNIDTNISELVNMRKLQTGSAYSHETLLSVREKIKLRFTDKALISYARNFAHKH